MAEISWFSTNDQIFQLKPPIPLTITKDGKDFYAENTTYDLLGVGYTEHDAVEDTRVDLGRVYEWKFDTDLPMPVCIPEWLEMIDSLIE